MLLDLLLYLGFLVWAAACVVVGVGWSRLRWRDRHPAEPSRSAQPDDSPACLPAPARLR